MVEVDKSGLQTVNEVVVRQSAISAWKAVNGGALEEVLETYDQCPEFKFRFLSVPLQMLRFSSLCEQIWQQFWGTYDLRSS